MVQGELIGQLVISDPQALVSDAYDIMTAVAERLSSHIENLRLSAQTEVALAQTEQQAGRLVILNEMGTAISAANSLVDIYTLAGQYTRQILNADYASLSLFDAGGDSFTGIAFDESGRSEAIHLPQAIAYALAQQKPIIAPQDFSLDDDPNAALLLRQGIQSYICAPLMVGDRSVGHTQHRQPQAHAYGATDLSLMQQIVSLLAATLESRRLFEETQRRANREALVNEISQKIQNAQTVESALQTAVAELGKALGIQRAIVELKTNQPEPAKPTNGHHI
jgi:GAF domain-containing protein